MTLTGTEARDAVIGDVNAAWLADPLSASIPMLYDNVKTDAPGADVADLSKGLPYARTTVRTFTSQQSTQGAQKRFLTTGAVTVQVFTPAGDGWALSDQLVRVILSALRIQVGSPNGVWYFDVVPNEIGISGQLGQVNVTAAFRYQEVA